MGIDAAIDGVFRPIARWLSEVVFFAGNYADYEEDRKRRLGADADSPHRIKNKRLDA